MPMVAAFYNTLCNACQAALLSLGHFAPAVGLQAADLVGFPAVIKPIYGAASIGVVRVDDFDSLEKSFAKVSKELAGARIVAGALQQAKEGDEDSEGNAGSWIKLAVMMEEYLDGPEVCMAVYFLGGWGGGWDAWDDTSG
jgi:biotin carboxylase